MTQSRWFLRPERMPFPPHPHMVGERGFEPLPLGYKPSARTYCATPPIGERYGTRTRDARETVLSDNRFTNRPFILILFKNKDTLVRTSFATSTGKSLF